MDYSTNSGIYKITCIENGKIYIGQSINIEKRLKTHRSTLLKGNHHNSLLQRNFNKYGLEKFNFEIIEKCSLNDLDERECYWIKYFDSTNRDKGFNFESGGNLNKIHHEETIEKMRKISQGTNSKLTEEQVREIKIALHMGVMQSDLVEIFGVSVDAINKISKGVNWYWLLPEFNDSQSKQIECFKAKMQKDVLRLFEKGYSGAAIKRKTSYTATEINSVLKGKHIQNCEERKENIIKDYESGLTKEGLSEKYNLNRNHIGVILKHKTEEEFEQRVLKIKEMYSKGFTNGQISKELGIHRTTVTDILKGRTKENKRKRIALTEDLKRKIIDLIEKGYSQRKVSELLDISRANVKKALLLEVE